MVTSISHLTPRARIAKVATSHKINGITGTEHALQVECVKWFRLQYREPQYMIAAIPNGGYRTKTTAKIMKAEGQLAGMPDLLIPMARKGYHCLWIEMKNGSKGIVSDVQKSMHEFLRSENQKVVICRTFDDFVKEINDYFS